MSRGKPIVRHREEPAFAAGAGAPDGLTLQLCERIAGVSYDALPRPVIDKVKALVLDTLGVSAAASRSPDLAPLLDRTKRWEPAGSATVLVHKTRVSPPSAAFLNAATAHALDFDDQHDAARVHTCCVSLPPLLAAAEADIGMSGRDLILSLALALEIHCRLGLACFNSIGKGWTPTVLFGGMAAAAGLAHKLGLSPERHAHAVGIAYSMAAGNMQSRNDGAVAKRLAPGHAARSAFLAAFLAADGVTGPVRALEGEHGLFALYERGEVLPALILEDWGATWRLLEISVKPYPCCRCNHTIIDLALELRRRGLRAGEIASVDLLLGQVNWEAVATPYRPELRSAVHAQFSAAYCFARALLDGSVSLRSFKPEALAEPSAAALAARARVLVDPEIAPIATEPARVRIVLMSGETLEIGAETMSGSPAAPLSATALYDKFAGCLRYGVDASNGAVEALAEAAMQLEILPRAADLIALFPNRSDPDRTGHPRREQC